MTSDHRSFMATKNTVVRSWYIVDATDKPLGRVASAVAMILMGKNKPTYTPHVDCGDFVVIINAEKVKLTGAKRENAKVYHYSGYPSGLRVAHTEKSSINSRNISSKKLSRACSPKPA